MYVYQSGGYFFFNSHENDNAAINVCVGRNYKSNYNKICTM